MPPLTNINLEMFGKTVGSTEQIGIELTNYFSKLDTILISENGAFHQAFQKVIPGIIIEHIHSRFWSESGPDGPWAEIKDITVRLKTEAGYQYIHHPGILQATRYMYESIKEYLADGWSIVIGTDAPYASRHQLGDLLLDKRAFLGMDTDLESKIENELQSELNRIIITL